MDDLQLFNEELITLAQLTKEKKSHYYSNFGSLIYLNIILLILQSLTSAGKNVLYQVFVDADYSFLGPT